MPKCPRIGLHKYVGIGSSSSSSVKSSKGSSSSSEAKAFTKSNPNSGEGGKTWKSLGRVGT